MPACLKNRLPAAALLLLFALPAAADFKVVDVQPRLDGGALLLNGNIDLTLSSKVEEALSKGIQLEVVIDVRLYRLRWFVWHQGIGSWTLRRRIGYHALSGQYLVGASETNAETKESHSSAQEALKALGALNDVRLPLAGDAREGGDEFGEKEGGEGASRNSHREPGKRLFGRGARQPRHRGAALAAAAGGLHLARLAPQQRMEHMEVRALIARTAERYLAGIVPLAVLSGLLLAALLMMHAATQNSALFGRVYSLLLLVNVLGIVLLLGMILLNIYRLMEQHRARALGSRLTLRLLVMFVLLSVLPVTVVFFFSIQTLNRGIDNWFDVKVERALDDALLLGRSALEATKQDLVKNAQAMGQELELIPTDARGARTLLSALNSLREQYGVTELTLFSQDGKILASAVEAAPESGTFVPNRPRDTILAQVRQGLAYANLDATGKSGLQLRVVVPVYGREVGSPVRVLQVLQTLAPRYAKLGESVQSAFADYEKLVYLRGPLKFGFTLTLSLVALLTMLVAVWAAIFSARRVVAPIRDLAEATRAVADGDYRKQIPVTSRDEIGILVESFNEMTRRIHRAQTQIKRSQQEAELQRAYLETVLTHLSSGVLSFDARARRSPRTTPPPARY